jgi:hypothetical protein
MRYLSAGLIPQRDEHTAEANGTVLGSDDAVNGGGFRSIRVHTGAHEKRE